MTALKPLNRPVQPTRRRLQSRRKDSTHREGVASPLRILVPVPQMVPVRRRLTYPFSPLLGVTGYFVTADFSASHLDVVHHVLDPRVILETIDGKILAVARLLESAVGHFGDHRNVGVHPYATKVEISSEAHRSTVVFRPH